MTRSEKAVELKHSGSNCAQAVLLACKDVLDLDEDALKKLGAAFAVGMGNMESTCGALIAAQMIHGLINYKGYPIVRDAKEISEIFKIRCGALKCGTLKGMDTGTVLCPCDDCIRCAVDILEESGII